MLSSNCEGCPYVPELHNANLLHLLQSSVCCWWVKQCTVRFLSTTCIILGLVLGITSFFLQTFVGNIDRNSEVKHVLYGVLTRYLRFLPKTHQSRVCMRTEVFGVKTKPGDDNYVLKHNWDVLLYVTWTVPFVAHSKTLFLLSFQKSSGTNSLTLSFSIVTERCSQQDMTW